MNYREILEDFVNNENTNYCYDWQGFNYEIILPCIEQLLKNENNLQSKIDKANQYLEEYFIFDDKNGEYYQTHTFDKDNAKELRDILKKED